MSQSKLRLANWSAGTSLLAAATLALVASCGAGGGGDSGLTPGGIKDLNTARDLIAAGMVPPADSILPEAMFAEHDLPIDGPPCVQAVCVRAAPGFAPDHDGQQRAFVQLGLSTAISPATFVRPPTSFVFTADISGSMGWTSSEDGDSPGQLARMLMHRLASSLGPNDDLAIVTYGSEVRTVLTARGNQQSTIHAAIDALGEGGVTNMEAGMERALAVGRAWAAPNHNTRMVVFSDEQPNVGATDETTFGRLVRTGHEDGVDTTIFALGLGVGAELLRGMANWPGANAYSMTSRAQVSEFMETDAPFFATPIASNLRVNIGGLEPWSIDRGIGFPAADDGEFGLKVGTLFLSTRRGALLVAFDPGTAGITSLSTTLDLAYVDSTGEHQESLPVSLEAAPDPEADHWFSQVGVAHTTALGLLTEAMHNAALVYGTNPDEAATILIAAEAQYAAFIEEQGTPSLAVELQLVRDLLVLVQAGAQQGTLYGDYY